MTTPLQKPPSSEILESYARSEPERLSAVETELRHMATQTDIANLRADIGKEIAGVENKIDVGMEELKRFIEKEISQAEIKTLKQFIQNWTTGASIAIPVLTAIVAAIIGVLFR